MAAQEITSTWLHCQSHCSRPKRHTIYLNLMGLKKDLKSSKQTYWMKDSFDSAVDACDAVFHTACPVANDPQSCISKSTAAAGNVLKGLARFYIEGAKENADVIIMDDNFTTILNVARWGRAVYINIQKFVQFQLTLLVLRSTLGVISRAEAASQQSQLSTYLQTSKSQIGTRQMKKSCHE
ncbi:hypothetical protein Ddye_031810 [Dipteronia dyeriana]|uniref:3-beta hydroxysteroid dehydrogenase/isomerase domain-containing protein n=1 Tax=Dipteronia dyeriana TaxID=168575 RepID=A0AAD9TJK6_9ROSI|nr:hypothetical protein Ddye_031810 [Dipteronia dyeriana]